MIKGRGEHLGTRREFLTRFGAGLFGVGLPRFSRLSLPGLPQGNSEHPFELVPPETSGITWVHHNGRSPEMYLPETVGAGCGFVDYDNDGWVDIYLVNSGKCDFLDPKPPLRNALFRNNRDGTFTDTT